MFVAVFMVQIEWYLECVVLVNRHDWWNWVSHTVASGNNGFIWRNCISPLTMTVVSFIAWLYESQLSLLTSDLCDRALGDRMLLCLMSVVELNKLQRFQCDDGSQWWDFLLDVKWYRCTHFHPALHSSDVLCYDVLFCSHTHSVTLIKPYVMFSVPFS